jgi:hypothetical protein
MYRKAAKYIKAVSQVSQFFCTCDYARARCEEDENNLRHLSCAIDEILCGHDG